MENKNKQLNPIQLSNGNPKCLKYSEAITQTHATRGKIRDLRDDNPLVGMLAYIFKLVGLQATPGPETMTVLLKFIKEKYKHLAPEDLILAFEGAIAGEFSANLDHYQSFSPLYLSGVINPYIKHRGQLLVKESQTRQTEMLNEKSEAEKEAIHCEYLKNALIDPYNLMVKTGNYTFTMEWQLFETLEKKGVLLLTIEEKREIYEEAKAKFLKRIEGPANDYQQKREFKKIGETIGAKGIQHYQNTLQNHAKTEAFKRFIVEAANKKINLETLLNNGNATN